MTENIAVVLFNLGGPDRPKAVRPFLFNLFRDRAIISLPAPLRMVLAGLIALKRAPTARRIYARLGGGSPIYENTCRQAEALEAALNKKSGARFKTFVCMRYWHPMSPLVAEEVKRYAPNRIVLLPLYPQFSTTTTASSFADWDRAARKARLRCPTARIRDYPAENHFIAAQVDLLRQAYWEASQEDVRVLFSAHGLPEKIIRRGDPYARQVEQTVQAIVGVLAMDGMDYITCYQSRVGPLEWIKPSTEAEIRRAGREGKSLVVVPVSFVSEHSETLVELDLEYAELARKAGVKNYVRVPALGTHPVFIEGLASLVNGTLAQEEAGLASTEPIRPPGYSPRKRAAHG